MADDVDRRMGAATHFVDRLAYLEPAEWGDVVTAASQAAQSEFYQLALELVHDATLLAGEPLTSRYSRLLIELDRRIDEIVGHLAGQIGGGVPAGGALAGVAKAAANAILVRNAHGFSVGAFNELVGPFRRVIDLTLATNGMV
jgi:hypothetical protein